MSHTINGPFLEIEGPCQLLTQPGPPAMTGGKMTQRALPLQPGPWYSWLLRFFTPDRYRLRLTQVDGKAILAKNSEQHLTELLPTPEKPIAVLTSHLLATTPTARQGASTLQLIPFSAQGAVCVTHLAQDWCVLSSQSLLKAVTLEEDENAFFHKDAVVAWCGKAPRGFCQKVQTRDILLPRRSPNISLSFQGPAIVWIQTP